MPLLVKKLVRERDSKSAKELVPMLALQLVWASVQERDLMSARELVPQ